MLMSEKEYNPAEHMRYWMCECCGLPLAMYQRDDTSSYPCPACAASKYDHGGKFVEIDKEEFKLRTDT